jgi:hypothetical protein
MLEWIDQPGFREELNELLKPAPIDVPANSAYLPLGTAKPQEARLDKWGRTAAPHPTAWDDLKKWWLRHPKGANTPNWDFASTCTIENVEGLLLVEAKANTRELSRAGKRLVVTQRGKSRTEVSIRRTSDNHDHIGEAIGLASRELCRLGAASPFSIRSHYQLANRLAFAWKLASLGFPVALLYLGFYGDNGLAASFVGRADWEETFEAHASGVVSLQAGKPHVMIGNVPIWILLRSRQVLDSPPVAV